MRTRANRLVVDTNVLTGDHDLLAMHPFRSIPILDPGTFLKDMSDPDRT